MFILNLCILALKYSKFTGSLLFCNHLNKKVVKGDKS